MPKKPPSLEKQTQWHGDRAKYAAAVLAGVRFEKVTEPSKPWASENFHGMTYRTYWRFFLPWRTNETFGGHRTRRAAVEGAIYYLEIDKGTP